jgi:hypothetical protein
METAERPTPAADAARRTIDFSYAPTSGWTLICRPDDPLKTLVREDGALLYGFRASSFDAWSFDAVLEFHAQTADAPLPVIEQRTETARRPIVHTSISYPSVTLELTTFASAESGRRCDVVLWTLTAADDVDEVLAGVRIEAHLRGAVLAGADGGPCHEVHAVNVDPLPPTPEWMDDLPRIEAPPEESMLSLHSIEHPLLGVHAAGFRPASALLTRPVLLRGGGSVAGALVIRFGGSRSTTALGGSAVAALDTERRFWDELELMPAPLEVPDSAVQDMLLACSRNLLQAREVEAGLPALHVGPTIYRGLWVVDGYFMLEAARYLGFDEVADAGVQVLLRRATASGAFQQLADIAMLKETGLALATIVRQAELTGDPDWLRPFWPVVRAAVSHVEELREQTLTLGAEHPLHGLMPEAFGDGGLGGTRPEYTTTLSTLFGLKFAVRGARLIGDTADEERFSTAYERLRREFHRSAERHRARLDGHEGTYLPMALPGSGAHQFYPGFDDADVPAWRLIRPETATWALCQAIWPGQVFGPDEQVVQDLLRLLDMRDDEEGIPATTGFLSYRGVWTYAATLAASVWLYADRPDKATDYLYSFANHAFPTRVWREEQPLREGGHWQICGDMPHNWASAEFIRLVRHLLVFEDDDALLLLRGLPAEWLYDGASLQVENTPTRFGAISLSLRVSRDSFSVTVVRQPREHQNPSGCTLVVPSGFERRLRVDGQEVRANDGRLELSLQAGARLVVDGTR